MNATTRTLMQSLTLSAAMLIAATCPADIISDPIASSAQPDDSPGSMLVVYDVRDLATMLSPQESTAGVPVLKDVPLIGNLFRGGAPGGGRGASAEQPITSRSVINSLAEASSMIVQTISPGVLAATGTKDQHELFQRLINQLRTVDSGTYELEVTVSKAAPDQTATIGQPFAATGEVLRIKQAVRGRAQASIHATESTTYIREWLPVVGNSSVGYQSQTAEVISGLQLGATVAPSSAGRVDVRIQGSLDKAEIHTTKNPVTGGASSTNMGGQGVPSDLGIGLPRVQSRSIAAELDLPLDQATTIGVISGFGDSPAGSSQLVVAVKVKQLRPPGASTIPSGPAPVRP